MVSRVPMISMLLRVSAMSEGCSAAAMVLCVGRGINNKHKNKPQVSPNILGKAPLCSYSRV